MIECAQLGSCDASVESLQLTHGDQSLGQCYAWSNQRRVRFEKSRHVRAIPWL